MSANLCQKEKKKEHTVARKPSHVKGERCRSRKDNPLLTRAQATRTSSEFLQETQELLTTLLRAGHCSCLPELLQAL